MASSNTTSQLATLMMNKCIPNADRLSNASKNFIDLVSSGNLFENKYALGIAAWLGCSTDLKTLVSSIPPWIYQGGVNDQGITPEQIYFYERLEAVEGPDGPILAKLRTMQFGPESPVGPFTTFTDRIASQQTNMNAFKTITDNQSGTGDPIEYMKTLGVADAYNTAKQQMEGGTADNFSSFFNSVIQGPTVVDKIQGLLCTPNSIGNILNQVLNMIAGALPFGLDDLNALFGGPGMDEFFDGVDFMISQMAGMIEYANYILEMDMNQASLGQLYVTQFTLGQFLAAGVRGEGYGNCIQRAMLEQFTGSDNVHDAIAAIDLETQQSENSTTPAVETVIADIGKVGKVGKVIAPSRLDRARKLEEMSRSNTKELFFPPIPDAVILRSSLPISPTPTPVPYSHEDINELTRRILELEGRLWEIGYAVIEGGDNHDSDAGYFNEYATDTDGIAPADAPPVSPTPSPTRSPSPSPTPSPTPSLLMETGAPV